jgi:chromosome segregation ATPase
LTSVFFSTRLWEAGGGGGGARPSFEQDMFGFSTDRKVRQLREDLDRLENRFKGLELEWQDTYDKVRRAMARIVKSRGRMEELDRAVEQRESTGVTPGIAGQEVVPTTHALLSPRQKEIQQKILQRRAGG